MSDDLSSTAPRYCDLVMKGGITSGLVYPKAVLELSERYRFKNIGGTSAGAIAAALSAAAALGERRRQSGASTSGGFERLRTTAADLTTKGFIFSLFQPVPALRRAYKLLVRLSAKPPRWQVYTHLILYAVAMAPVMFTVTIAIFGLLAYALAGSRGVLAASPPVLACALALAIYRGLVGTAGKVRRNRLGICPGTRQTGFSAPGLSDWMHSEICALAGRAETNPAPVRFRDLWQAPILSDETPPGPDERVLSLQVITSDISHSEPRTLPLTSGTLWFREDDMLALFPACVVADMVATAGMKQAWKGVDYHQFPDAGDLPIVVAARMSLSFPLLITAVPLHEKHFLRTASTDAQDARSAPGATMDGGLRLSDTTEQLTANGDRTNESLPHAGSDPYEMRVCWFSDGGISSNFPLHLFDAPLPRWPTFAIDLVYPPEDAPPSSNPVFLPQGNHQGWRPRYTDLARKDALAEIGAFVGGIVKTMQNWRDLLQGRAPGHRDRVVQVEVAPSEGGMNLNMAQDALTALSDKGALAGQALEHFDFENHFWVRYRNLQAAMERYGFDLARAMASPPVGAEQAYARTKSGWEKGGPYPFTADQAAEAQRRLAELLQAMAEWEDFAGTLTKGAPKPAPHLRIVPTF